MSPAGRRWGPAAILAVGALLATFGVRAQRVLGLRAELSGTVPASIDGYTSRDIALSDDERVAVAVTSYLVRIFDAPPSAAGTGSAAADSTLRGSVWLYVGFYDRQTRGRTIHSPKNCLPGAGWEALTNQVAEVTTPDGAVRVNRYLIQRGQSRALVLYWYQGRGRVAWNEYQVKWDLLRDAALRRRSDEALVRIVVPITTTENEAFARASRFAATLVPAVRTALPAA